MVKKDARERIAESVGTRVTRRTVARGIAWTTPVVAVAAAAPAFATSHCEVILELEPTKSCKAASDKDYLLVFKVSTVGDCVDTTGCTGVITKVTEATGQGRVLYGPPSPAVPIGEPVKICDANNLSAFLIVTATLSCDGGVPKDYEVKLGQFQSTAGLCVSTDFCG